MTELRPGLIATIVAVGLLVGACGDGDESGPQFVEVPLGCDGVVDRLEERAGGWPDPADPQDLIEVNNDLSAAVNALPEDCDAAVFDRIEAIECDYLTAVEPADAAAGTILEAQRGRCDDERPPEADPGDPTATIEEGGAGVPADDACDRARNELVVEGIIPDASNLPTGCSP